MCGRMVAKNLKGMARTDPKGRTVGQIIRDYLKRDPSDRFNIAPMQAVLTLSRAEDGGWEALERRWGLVPSWAKDEGLAPKLINARAETVAEKPSFRAAFKSRRVLVPVSGFYEWAVLAGRKRPYFIHPAPPDEHWLFAGLAETWKGPEGPLETFTVVTTAANLAMEELHDRMPVILGPGAAEAWLDPATPPGDLRTLLRPCPDTWVEAWEVGSAVGNVRAEGPGLIAAV